MIFSTFNQLNSFIIFLFCGFIYGFICSIFKIIFLIKNEKIIKKSMFDCIFYAFLIVFYYFLTIFLNFGNISLVLLLSLIVGKISFEWLGRNLVVFLQNKWYNIINKRKLNARRKKN